MQVVRLLLVMLGIWLGMVGVAAGHASLTSTQPAEGAIVPTAPTRFVLTFTEPVSSLALSLILPDATTVALALPAARSNVLEIEAPAHPTDGTHVLVWRVVSLDGHPVGGSLIFSIGAPSIAPPAMSEIHDASVRAGLWLTKLSIYAGLALGIGGAFTIAWLLPSSRSGRKVVAGALLLGLSAAALSPGFQGLDALGANLVRYVEPIVWSTGLRTSYGWTVITMLVALIVAGLSLVTPASSASRILSASGLFIGAVALALSGHASAAEPQWLARPFVFIHAVAVAIWIGALLPLSNALRYDAADSVAALRAFSRWIPAVLVVLIIAGMTLAAIQVQQPGELWRTDYGRLLIVKLALVATLLALAAINRWRLTEPATARSGPAARALVRTIATETLVALIILGVVAGWRFTPPPRALATANALPASVHLHTAEAMADVSVTPGRAGPVTVSAVIMTGEFGPLDAKEMTIVFAQPKDGVQPFAHKATQPGDGTWQAEDIVLPVAGYWTIRLEIRTSDFDLISLEGEIPIRP